MRPPLALLRDPEAQADAAMLVSIEPARAGVDLHTLNALSAITYLRPLQRMTTS